MVKSAYFCNTFISNKLFEGTYFAWWLYIEMLKFSDLSPIYQIRQSFHLSKFLVLQYVCVHIYMHSHWACGNYAEIILGILSILELLRNNDE